MTNRMVVFLVCALAGSCGGSPPQSAPSPSPPAAPEATRAPVEVAPDHPVPRNAIALADAVDQRLIAIRPRGAGVQRISLELVAHADVAVAIPAGTYFRGVPDKDFQNMVVTKSVGAQLAAGTSIVIAVPAACTNFHRRMPGVNDRFELASAEPALHHLVTCLEHRDVDNALRQIIVWTLTDAIDRESLTRRKGMLAPYLVEKCTRRLRQPAARCTALVDAAYDAAVDELLERRDAFPECSSPADLAQS